MTICAGSCEMSPEVIAYDFYGAQGIYIAIAGVHYTDGTYAKAPSYDYCYWEY